MAVLPYMVKICSVNKFRFNPVEKSSGRGHKPFTLFHFFISLICKDFFPKWNTNEIPQLIAFINGVSFMAGYQDELAKIKKDLDNVYSDLQNKMGFFILDILLQERSSRK